MTPAEEADFYTRQYNPRLSIPNVQDIFSRWANQAAATRSASPQARLHLAYGAADKETLDFFPTAGRNAPLLVFIHGGYWRAMDKDDFSWVAPPFVAGGVNVAVVNYTLVPVVGIEDIVRQMLSALTWLWHQASPLGFNRDRIVVSGHSAGGHLTGMMLAARWREWAPDLPADLVKGGVTLSALFDLRPFIKSPFFNDDFKLDEALARKLSPGLMTPATRAPIYTVVGGDESAEFQKQNRMVAECWPSAFAGDIPAPGRNHLTVCDALAEPGHPLFETTLKLCRGA